MRNHEYETDSEERLREETDQAHEFLHCEHDRGDDVVPPWKGVAGPPAGVSHTITEELFPLTDRLRLAADRYFTLIEVKAQAELYPETSA
jgi:hypothetical protein